MRSSQFPSELIGRFSALSAALICWQYFAAATRPSGMVASITLVLKMLLSTSHVVAAFVLRSMAQTALASS